MESFARKPLQSSESRAISLQRRAHGRGSEVSRVATEVSPRHFNGQFDRIERIAVALHDERSSLDRREIRRSEVHIVITGGKRFRALEESPEPADHHPNDGGEEIPVAPREGCPHTDA